MNYLPSLKLIMVIFIITLANKSIGQENINYTKIRAHFIVEDHWVITQKYADSIAMRQSEFFSRPAKSDTIKMPPRPPQVAVFNRRQSTHLFIQPEDIVYYTIRDVPANDSTIIKDVTDIYKIDREGEKIKVFSPHDFKMKSEYNIRYKSDDRFVVVEENKNKIRKICGYDCFQVIMQDNSTNRPVELYVTEEIVLEYHPVFNVKKYLTKYYPLYLKFYDPEFPLDNYREYTFFKF